MIDVIRRCRTSTAFQADEKLFGKAPRSYFEEEFFFEFSIMAIEAHCTPILVFCILRDLRESEFISF
jgi:hypothetical protein